ncbi:hypothetical protein [Gemmatimonas sp.]
MPPIITETRDVSGSTTVTLATAAPLFPRGEYVRIGDDRHRIVSVGGSANVSTLTIRPAGRGWRETVRARVEDWLTFPGADAWAWVRSQFLAWVGRR